MEEAKHEGRRGRGGGGSVAVSGSTLVDSTRLTAGRRRVRMGWETGGEG